MSPEEVSRVATLDPYSYLVPSYPLVVRQIGNPVSANDIPVDSKMPRVCAIQHTSQAKVQWREV